MYLGYDWERQVTKLASRVTLLVGEEIELSFLSSTKVKAIGAYDKEKKDWDIKGFVIPYKYVGKISREKVEEMIADLDCIHLNKSYDSELALAVCAYPSIMQAYYTMMWEGNVASAVMREVGGTDALIRMYNECENEIKKIEERLQSQMTHHQV
jgi:hypothetical protein